MSITVSLKAFKTALDGCGRMTWLDGGRDIISSPFRADDEKTSSFGPVTYSRNWSDAGQIDEQCFISRTSQADAYRRVCRSRSGIEKVSWHADNL